ncbi:hypothetical protein U9M48_045044 [Paspalum notatum var. saurae]|uniref:1-phosphatidylinositol 4-kinase n=1 Tax=Paspalum notatum var. saurae TaxID=547442 RepID=A0AAQ3UWX6_PASNO
MWSPATAGATACSGRDELGLGLGLLALRPPHRASSSSSSPSSSITIYLTAPGLAVMPMRVLATDSVASVKLRVQTSQGVVVRKQKLVFHGRELARDDGRIRDYGVAHGNVVHLVIRVPDLRLITVETLQGDRLRFRVQPGRTVGYVKRRIAEDHRLVLHGHGAARPDEDDKQQQIISLVLQGEELDDRHLIHDVCRADGAVIHLLLVHRREDPGGRDHLEVSIVARDAGQTEHLGINTIEPVAGQLLPPVLRHLIDAVRAGMESGHAPVMSSEGTGGAYFMRDASGQRHVAVFKPADEEPMAANNPRGLPVSITGEGLKKGTRVGEGALREVAAYILDHPSSSSSGSSTGFAGVPPTALVRCTHGGFRRQPEEGSLMTPPPEPKLGSMQAFVNNCGSCEDMGPRAFPVQEVHKICVLDIRLANADRHAGNILVCRGDGEGGGMSLVPIDHGYCLPESFEDCTFEWLYWPQSREPFSQETVEYVRSLDADEDVATLRLHGWEVSRECARTLRVATMLLKKGVERSLTAFDIGSILCRETLTKESTVEEILLEAARRELPCGGAGDEHDRFFSQAVSEIMDRRLDELASADTAKLI